MEFVRNVNWELLRKQKLTLVTLARNVDSRLTDTEVNDLDGLVYLIDAVQDEAVANEGVDEALVFGNLKEV